MALSETAQCIERRVLVVDDDAGWRESTASFLAQNGLAVVTARDGQAMQRQLERGKVDLVLLDVLMPPGEDGLSICRRVASRTGPAVILMGDGADDIDRIVGLELGADDYVSKPCHPRELIARVRAVLRRTFGMVTASPSPALVFDGWRLDVRTRELSGPNGIRVTLPFAEYALLTALAERPHRPLSRDHLSRTLSIRGEQASERAIDIRACRLRKLLGPGLIQTVRHLGYRLEAKVAFETV